MLNLKTFLQAFPKDFLTQTINVPLRVLSSIETNCFSELKRDQHGNVNHFYNT